MKTDHELIEEYFRLKSIVAKRTEELKPYEDGMAVIENVFLQRLNERGADNTKTDAGTAYKRTITNFNVVDQQAFLQFCLKYPSLADMYTVKAVKDPVKEFMNGSKDLPPGLEQTEYTKVNLRRS